MYQSKEPSATRRIAGIDIFDFQEPREYLHHAVEHLKKNRRGFKLKTFATQAGFRSPSTVSMILKGQRALSPAAAEKFARVLRLPPRQRNYFLAMARLPAARSANERIEVKEAMIKWREKRGSAPLPSQQYRFLANWYYPVLFVLGGMPNTEWDVASLVDRFSHRVSAEEIKIALSDLLSLGMLCFQNGRFVRGSASFTTAEDVRDAGVFTYHCRMNELARSALEQPLDEREMNGLTVAIPRALLPKVKERIRTFRKELDEYLCHFENDAEEVYQLNLQLFPLTRKGKSK